MGVRPDFEYVEIVPGRLPVERITVRADDHEASALFQEKIDLLFGVALDGIWHMRIDENRHCRLCALRRVCRRHDSLIAEKATRLGGAHETAIKELDKTLTKALYHPRSQADGPE